WTKRLRAGALQPLGQPRGCPPTMLRMVPPPRGEGVPTARSDLLRRAEVGGDGADGLVFGVVGWVAVIFGEGGGGPGLHGGEAEEARGVGAGAFFDRRAVGLDAEGDRGEEGVDGGEFLAGEEGAAEAEQAVLPEVLEAVEILAEPIRHG